MIKRIIVLATLLLSSLASYASYTIATAAVNNQTDKGATPYYAVLRSDSVLSDNGITISFVDEASKDMPAGTTSVIYLENAGGSNTTGVLKLVYTISTTNNPNKGGSIGTCTFTLDLSASGSYVSVNSVQASCDDTLGVNATYTTTSSGQTNLNIVE